MWQVCYRYGRGQALSRRIIMKDICMTLPCLDKFCGLHRSSLEGKEKRVCYLKGGTWAVLLSLLSAHSTSLCPCRGSPSVLPHFLWTRSKHTNSRTQCWWPTPHLSSIVHDCTCVSTYSVLTSYWYPSHLTEGSNCLSTPNYIKNQDPGKIYQDKSEMEVHELCPVLN